MVCLQFVVLQNEDLSPMHQLSQKTQMIQLLERHEKPNSREIQPLGKPSIFVCFYAENNIPQHHFGITMCDKFCTGRYFLLRLPWELQCLLDYISI